MSPIFRRKKPTTKPFSDFYSDWITTLSTTLLPNLRRLLSSPSTSPSSLSLQVDSLHTHFRHYYTALDSAALSDVSQTLFPPWRSPLETPFLFLADLHPYLLTNLLRSFLDQDDDESYSSSPRSSDDRDYESSPTKKLTSRVEQIECGLRLMVPALAARARQAQVKMVESVVGKGWGDGGVGKGAVEEGVEGMYEEMAGIVVDANRLRVSVIADVLSVASVYQSALFLEALGGFLVGFRDEKLVKEFCKCDVPIINS